MVASPIVSIVILIGILLTPWRGSAQPAPYTGQQALEIKALSHQDIHSYLSGDGMGLAKAAELNHYPGPKHVLELAESLGLSARQREQTQALFEAMRREAIQLGQQIVEAERRLDHLFASQTLTEKTLDEATRAIALSQGKLRNVHLRAHLAQRGVLNDEQIKHYDRLRGYTASVQDAQPHRHQH